MKPIDPRVQQIQHQIAVYQNLAAQDYNIPAAQSLPIASRPDIAFRPSCAQIEPVWEPEQTAWVWQGETLYKTPGAKTATNEVLSNLQAAGICLADPQAQAVPLVMTDEVFTEFQELALPAHVTQAQDSQQVVSQLMQRMAVNFSLDNGWDLFVLAPMPLISLAIGIMILTRFDKKKKSKRDL